MNINFNIDSTDDVVTAITMLNYLLDGMKQKTERAIEKSDEKSNRTVEKSESTPEFETSADSKNPVENGEVTPDMMIKFITEKLKSMAKNGNKETAKQFMRDHKLPNVSALSSLAISRLETVYHDVAKI